MSEQKICPYPGLRPFTEEESIFFKGRDKHIEEIIHQAEEKKFVMLTGASGDGKSSIVYAGVIPQARAGFFKAKYNNWLICTFRPERTPLENMANSIGGNLNLDIEKTKREFTYGFSALVDLYTSSPYYINEKSEEFLNADEKTRKQLKRKGANLFILVDQFEEFFTNPENYNNGKASVEAQTVVNLLLESAKIALADDIPIYIICTMRSDYIGQCAAFRNLPEFIGFSQFFVPRLKRQEIYDVIEEPALLSGNSISKRLIEVLVNDLREGFDQLPVLQHALNQVWKKADSGNEEMDLIHLAKVSGMPAVYLPENDQKIYKEWYSEILQTPFAEFIKRDFASPSLENILNTHANELYEKTTSYYAEKNPNGKQLNSEQVKIIIKKTFQCLTKIDDGRAVRNRLTLQEITGIINDKEITTKEVNKVINIFREQGNTFIYPFINDNRNNLELLPDTVLDITHESLIRNWTQLEEWAKDEFENYQNYIDFNKQLNRWTSAEKTAGFLLPIGSYTFFEKWYDECVPNKCWLARYDEREIKTDAKLEEAEKNLSDTKQFLKRSARKLTFSRFVLKYGANRIAAAIGIVFLLSAITYYTLDFRKKQNGYVVKEVSEKGIDLLKSNYVNIYEKAKFIVNHERLHPGSFPSLLNKLKDTLALDLAYETFFLVQNITDKKGSENLNLLVKPLIYYIDSATWKNISDKDLNNGKAMKKINNIIAFDIFLKNYNFELSAKIDIAKYCNKLKDILFNDLPKINDLPKVTITMLSNFEINIFNHSLELFTMVSEQPQDWHDVIRKISPFENSLNNNYFNILYNKNHSWFVNKQNSISHNGGYQILAYLYARTGDNEKLSQCLDSLFKNNPNYMQFRNQNFYKILLYKLYSNSFNFEEIEPIINKYCKLTKTPVIDFYDKLCYYLTEHINMPEENIKLILSSKPYDKASKQFQLQNENLIAYHLSSSVVQIRTIEFFSEQLKSHIKNADELNFRLAILNKRFNEAIEAYDKKCNYQTFSDFGKAFEHYSKVNNDYLHHNDFMANYIMPSYFMDKSTNYFEMSKLFLEPSLSYFETNLEDLYYVKFNQSSQSFLKFLIDHPDYMKYYKTEYDYKTLLNYWYNYSPYSTHNKNIKSFDFAFFEQIYKLLNTSKFVNKKLNDEFYYIVKICDSFQQGSRNSALTNFEKYINELKAKAQTFPTGDFFSTEYKDIHEQALMRLITFLAVNDSVKSVEDVPIEGVPGLKTKSKIKDHVFRLLDCLPNKYNKNNTLIDILINIQKTDAVCNTFAYLDALYSNIEKNNEYGLKVFQVFGMIGSTKIYELSNTLLRNVNDNNKSRALLLFINGLCYNGNYYKAKCEIPDNASLNFEMQVYNQILHDEIIKNKGVLITWNDESFEGFDRMDYQGQSMNLEVK